MIAELGPSRDGVRAPRWAKVPRRRGYSVLMRQIWTGRIGMMAGKYGEHAPVVAACCNACRTCVTTNVLTLVMGAGAAVSVWATRFVKRLPARPF